MGRTLKNENAPSFGEPRGIRKHLFGTQMLTQNGAGVIAPNFQNIETLPIAARPQWLLWRLEKRGDKTTKVPYSPKSGKPASSTDSSTWGTFEDVRSHYEHDGFSGVGFVVTDGDGFVGVDLDKCRDEQGNIEPWASEIIEKLASYTEISPSGTGVHILCKGKLPDGCRKRKDQIEVYESGRYFTVTGRRLPNSVETIEQRDRELAELVGSLKTTKPKPAPSKQTSVATADDLLSRAFDSKNGAAIEALYRGDWSSYPSQSEADLALCSHLMWRAKGDTALVDRWFRASGLFREKWDELHGATTYGGQTLAKASKGQGSYRDDPAASDGEGETERDNLLKRRYKKAEPLLRQRLRFNELTRELELDGVEFDHGDLQMELAKNHNLFIPDSQANLIFGHLARQNNYHPIRDYLSRVAEQQGGGYDISNLATRFFGTDNPLYDLMLRKFLIACVARIFDRGCKVDTALILQGRQGQFKSGFLEALASPSWFSDEAGDVKNKDELIKMHRVWLIEWAELEKVFCKRDNSDIKAFLTTKNDRIREPYARAARALPRGFVIAGTTNESEFLGDPTGSRRFWVIPVRVQKIDIEAVRRDRDQLWAAAVAAYRAEESWWLSPEHEALSENLNTDYKTIDPWESPIFDYIGDRDSIAISELLNQCLKKEPGQQGVKDQTRIANILKRHGWAKTRVTVDGRRPWMYTKNSTFSNQVGHPRHPRQETLEPLHSNVFEVSYPNPHEVGQGRTGVGHSDSSADSVLACVQGVLPSDQGGRTPLNPDTARDSDAPVQGVLGVLPISIERLKSDCSEHATPPIKNGVWGNPLDDF